MSLVGRTVTALRSEGIRSAGWRVLKWLSGRFGPFPSTPLSSIHPEDAVAVDWTTPRRFNAVPARRTDGRYRVAWIISPPSATSGGHQTAFRFMRFLEDAGHELTIYLYSAGRYPVVSIDEIRRILREGSGYAELAADIRHYDPIEGLAAGFDAVVASDWEASYAAYRYPGDAKRFSFVQDFEPAFYAAGSDYVLAENSYRLGFHAFTAGRWLAHKLGADYGMSCDPFDFAVDTSRFHLTNAGPRSEVVFYVRPPTPRRATEFGLLALDAFHRLRPDVTINLVGWSMAAFDVPFPHVDHGAVDIPTLNAVLNRSAAGLVLSLTNMSLLPMEVMAAGAVPVVNDAPNTRGVVDSPYIEFVPLSPRAIAERLVAILERPDAVEHAATIARSVESVDWSEPAAEFVAAFDRAMRAGDAPL